MGTRLTCDPWHGTGRSRKALVAILAATAASKGLLHTIAEAPNPLTKLIWFAYG